MESRGRADHEWICEGSKSRAAEGIEEDCSWSRGHGGVPHSRAVRRSSECALLLWWNCERGPSACRSKLETPLFRPASNETVIALTNLIIPETDTPGAKAALVNRTIDLFLNDEEVDTQRQFLEGLAWIDGRSLRQYGKPFVDLPREQQTALLESLANPENRNPEDQPGVRFFEDIKDWTLFGYYTSEIGLEQELQYGGDAYHESFPGACTHPEHQS